jgi:hypothetical protein
MLLSGYYAVQKREPGCKLSGSSVFEVTSLMESVLYIGNNISNHVKGLLHRK